MLSRAASHSRNMSGYLIGLSSPSVVDRMTTRRSSPMSNSAGQTRSAHVFHDQQVQRVQGQFGGGPFR